MVEKVAWHSQCKVDVLMRQIYKSKTWLEWQVECVWMIVHVQTCGAYRPTLVFHI